MPPEAQVVIFEDDPDSQGRIREWIEGEENGNHTVMGTFSIKEEAKAAIPTMLKQGANVFVVDANLSPRDRSGQDGVELVQAINDEIVTQGLKDVFTVGFSGTQKIPGATVNVHKNSVMELGHIITNL